MHRWGAFPLGPCSSPVSTDRSSPFSLPVPGALQAVLGPAEAAMPELLRGKGRACGHRPSCGPGRSWAFREGIMSFWGQEAHFTSAACVCVSLCVNSQSTKLFRLLKPQYWSRTPPANARDLRYVGSIPGSGRSSGEGNGSPLQCS